MKNYVDVIVVIPVGPGTRVDFIEDTIAAYRYFSRCSHQFVIADDSLQGIGDALLRKIPGLDVIVSKKPSGNMAGLYILLANAYRHALDHYEFKLLFKYDTDALVTGAGPELDALKLFDDQPNLAIAGQYPLDYAGKLWDMGWPRARIMNGTMTWRYLKRPFANILLRKLYLMALKHNYRTGESVFGGAYFMSHAFLIRLRENRMLPNRTLRRLNLGEDHLFALLAKAFGMELGSLSGPGRPFALAWKGLPASPAELLVEGRKVIHSTRGWADLDEDKIRIFFRNNRGPGQSDPFEAS